MKSDVLEWASKPEFEHVYDSHSVWYWVGWALALAFVGLAFITFIAVRG